MTAHTRVRLSPDERRAQLLDLGVTLLATRSLDEISIDVLAEEAGISRGLLYHYFGNKHAFHEAVVRRAADDLIAQTAPPTEGDPLERLQASMEAYVDYVVTNYAGYRSLVKAAAGGHEGLRAIYDEVQGVLVERIFAEDEGTLTVPDTPAVRLVLRGWSTMVEELVLVWCEDASGVTREELHRMVTDSMPALVAITLGAGA
ncbi:MAG: TetR family transcriptional regulator [Nocardioides sp.]|nr:TetR family transcriptional regulator [Nocardioides sp.]